MPRLAGITVYPIKSFDGVAVETSAFVAGGGLFYDRRFALYDRTGKVINAKRQAAIHGLRAEFDLERGRVKLAAPGREAAEFALTAGEAGLERWCGDYFGFPVTLAENAETGFPDDLNAAGPTMISTATLDAVAGWFPGLDRAEVRRRFRANLEIGSDANAENAEAQAPFWEDRLFAADAAPDARNTVPFCVGEVRFEGTNPCARCPVPTRDSLGGPVWPRFAQIFQQQRAASLPAWAEPTAFDHFYRLAVNTRVPSGETHKLIRVGDRVSCR